MVSIAQAKQGVSLASHEKNSQLNQGSTEQGFAVGINSPTAVKRENSQKIDDAIELEQDAARLARNVIGVSHSIAAQNFGLQQSKQSQTVQSAQIQARTSVQKSASGHGQLSTFGQFQGSASQKQTTPVRKRNLFGAPPQQVTLHRPSGQYSQPATVVIR